MTETVLACPSCARELPPDAPAGLCPYCLLAPAETRVLSRFEPPSPETLQSHFDHLTIAEEIGHGGMGAVYRARQPRLDRDVAVKVLPPDLAAEPGFGDRFAREARTLARLTHPAIVGVHDFGQAGPYAYLVMEYVEGINLRERLASGPIAPGEALAIVSQVCDALQYAHDRGIVHRDIKPENILLAESPADSVQHGGVRIKIADFGLARVVTDVIGPVSDPRLTGTHQAVGTPHYMAPEQFATPQSVDHRADLFSLGVVFYEMLTGQLPLGRFAPPSERAAVNESVDRVVLKSLDPEPDRRYGSASGVKHDLEHPDEEPADDSPKADGPEKIREWAGRTATAAADRAAYAATAVHERVAKSELPKRVGQMAWIDSLAIAAAVFAVAGVSCLPANDAFPSIVFLLVAAVASLLVAAAARRHDVSVFAGGVARVGEAIAAPFRRSLRGDGLLRPLGGPLRTLPEPGRLALVPFGLVLYGVVAAIVGVLRGFDDEVVDDAAGLLMFLAVVVGLPLCYGWRDRIAVALGQTEPDRFDRVAADGSSRWAINWWGLLATIPPTVAICVIVDTASRGNATFAGMVTGIAVPAAVVAFGLAAVLAAAAAIRSWRSDRMQWGNWAAALALVALPVGAIGWQLAESTEDTLFGLTLGAASRQSILTRIEQRITTNEDAAAMVSESLRQLDDPTERLVAWLDHFDEPTRERMLRNSPASVRSQADVWAAVVADDYRRRVGQFNRELIELRRQRDRLLARIPPPGLTSSELMSLQIRSFVLLLAQWLLLAAATIGAWWLLTKAIRGPVAE